MFGIKLPLSIRATGLGALVLSVGLSACGEVPSVPEILPPPPVNTEPAQFHLFGSGQMGIVGQALARPIGVVVSDENGDPVPDMSVSFAIGAGDGYVSPQNLVTDGNGLARVRWVLGTTSGGHHRVIATLDGSDLDPVQFSATGVATTAVTLNLISGDLQSGPAGQPLNTRVTVQVQDQYGNGVEHQIVKFSTDVGHGYFIPEDVTADSQGIGTSTWYLGESPGSQEASVWSPGLTGSPVRISATAN